MQRPGVCGAAQVIVAIILTFIALAALLIGCAGAED